MRSHPLLVVLIVAVVACAAQRAPFRGSAVVIPGSIEAVNYDLGGEGVGYHDSDANNKGGAYRPEDAVDMVACAACSLSGYNVGWTVPGEWLSYSVSIHKAGAYVITARVASDGAGGSFHFELDGKAITAATFIPDSGGWRALVSLSIPAQFDRTGNAVLYLKMDTGSRSGYIGNFAYFNIVPADGSPVGGGPLIFSDEFDTFNPNVWRHERTANGGGNNEFNYHTGSKNNSYVRNGVLYLRPTLTSDRLGTKAVEGGYTLNMNNEAGGCTQGEWRTCSRTSGNGNVLPPIQSVRVNTRGTISCTYCHVQFRARLPRGDWLWPALWLLPVDSVYGGWPASGEIDVMEARGNAMGYSAGGVDHSSSALHWGPHFPIDSYYMTRGDYWGKGALSNDFHTFGVIWSPQGLTTYVDNVTNVVLKVDFTEKSFWTRGNFAAGGYKNPWLGRANSAPFDQPFYLVLNVAVGGKFFPDGSGKPWSNNDGWAAAAKFWKARDTWYPTWKGEAAAMAVDWIRIYDL